METFSALLAISAGNSPVTGKFPAQRPVTRSFDIFLDLRLNKLLNKQSWGWWFETQSRPLWRYYNGWVISPHIHMFTQIDTRRESHELIRHVLLLIVPCIQNCVWKWSLDRNTNKFPRLFVQFQRGNTSNRYEMLILIILCLAPDARVASRVEHKLLCKHCLMDSISSDRNFALLVINIFFRNKPTIASHNIPCISKPHNGSIWMILV